MLYIVPIVIIGACIAGILWIVVRRFPDLTVLNVDSIPEEREGKVRDRMVQEKLQRNFKKAQQLTTSVFKPIGQGLQSKYQVFHQKIMDLEKQVQQVSQPLSQLDARTKTQELLERAAQHQEKDEYEQAETTFIEVLSNDNENLDAYDGLIEIYIEGRDYRKARETARFLIKLLQKPANIKATGGDHRLASALAELGEIYELENKPDMALKQYQKAVEMEPSNPRLLDLLLKISIIMKRKDLAQQAFTDLRNADPENKKLAELQTEIDAMSDQA